PARSAGLVSRPSMPERSIGSSRRVPSPSLGARAAKASRGIREWPRRLLGAPRCGLVMRRPSPASRVREVRTRDRNGSTFFGRSGEAKGLPVTKVLRTISPVDGRVYVERPLATEAELDAALASAARAQRA